MAKSSRTANPKGDRKRSGPANSPFIVKVTDHVISIYCDGALHLWFLRDRLVGVQSWEEDGGKRPRFAIEYYIRGADTIETGYDRKADWNHILSELAKVLTGPPG